VKKPKPTVFETFAEESALAIEMRRLYSRLRQKVRGSDAKCFMITSASPSEGKSTVSSHLAMTIARHKKTKTVLVDADLRKSSVHKYVGMQRSPGLVECLTGERSIMECVRDTPIESLKILPAGRYESSPSYLFDSHRLSEVFTELKFYFDTVVVDSPPVIPVSDPVIMVPEMDGVLLVVMAGVTSRDLVMRARDVLLDVDANLIGVVVNNHAEVLPYYYSSKYYGYRDAELSQHGQTRDATLIPAGKAAAPAPARATSASGPAASPPAAPAPVPSAPVPAVPAAPAPQPNAATAPPETRATPLAPLPPNNKPR
jgi:capsular exopolysaccharide synthesis family protein